VSRKDAVARPIIVQALAFMAPRDKPGEDDEIGAGAYSIPARTS
jgi:hypothetical protein